MSTGIRVERICDFCGSSFVAKTTVTRYCSHICNSRAYKTIKRGQKVTISNLETTAKILNPLETVKAKDFLSIREACLLMGVSRMTLHRQIKARQIKATRLGTRVIISRKHLEELFIWKWICVKKHCLTESQDCILTSILPLITLRRGNQPGESSWAYSSTTGHRAALRKSTIKRPIWWPT